MVFNNKWKESIIDISTMFIIQGKMRKEELKKYSEKLMFKMSEDEYETLEQEFKVILKQMEKINQFDEIKGIEPMTFPFEIDEVSLREDEVGDYLSVDEVLLNAKHVVKDQVKVPKVVQ